MSLRIALAAAGAAVLVAAAPANAAITFNTTAGSISGQQTVTGSGSGLGNSISFASIPAAVTMTATGLSLSTTSGTFSASQTSLWSGGGLGTCNAIEGTGCSSPSHQVDNATDTKNYTNYPMKDFILLTFSTAVTIDMLKVATSSSADTDVTYYLGNVTNPSALAGATLASLTGLGFGAANTVNGSSGSGASNTITLSSSTKYNAVLVGTPTGQWDDAWKFQGVTVGTGPGNTPGVPEPMSLALLATGLIGLGAATRRRRAA